jgi:signal transduction histidine kinase
MILLNNSKDAIRARMDKKIIHNGNINITIYGDDEKGIMQICDNGGGVSDEIIDSIFDPYFTTKFNAQGTGIGLYLAKNIIESRMKGNIEVENTDMGCCFSLILPCVSELIRK